ncbi:porin family protein [Psychroserpens sp.]|uniref:porin family protein n=1 Tax=Psychroserpens sp. TaxID=2020870 RepID=UPI001B185815|nr:porin family protein [Psychroserpens sp.]MBO6607788.1 PorT family protein [Psychroserpens sp.]MBO6630316.1 PorT family protein [Psychroserpens sp.]MBO6654779.1 PorT family protein [Psychroserpens sp.]MBO6682797.1 PorT family protein [Psychroserpens sp.]MBO6751146.1 PorT family protein [Psychroserpens sp.]
MKYLLYIIIGIIFIPSLNAQDNPQSVLNDTVVDTKYREDQFYFSVTYNLLGRKPRGMSQTGFSSGFHLGFIRDMPLNKRRNIALGLGLGLSTNSYNQNIQITEINGTASYQIIDGDVTFSKNKFTTYLLEVPLELRWRTSTTKAYDFWRIYAGVKLGYVVYNSSKYRGLPNDIQVSNIDDFNRFQYGLTLSAGYSNVSVHLYYALNPIFNSDTKLEDTGETLEINAVKIGLIFYIL